MSTPGDTSMATLLDVLRVMSWRSHAGLAMTRADTRARLESIGIVPVVRASSAQLAVQAVEALLAGDLPVAEITLTVPDALSAIGQAIARFGQRALIGAGTVRCADEAHAAIQAGAQFIVSPGFDAEIVRIAHAHGVPGLPGVLTPTEVMAAQRAGADWVKIFPCAALGGASYLLALRGPFPSLKMLPTGGVSLANAAELIAAGAAAIGVGSELVDPTELESGQSTRLSERARAFVKAVHDARRRMAPNNPPV
jgi:2-dehydro-3-deoxyphosphogluconate aldolase/(4S)-4-hydroxy-2-oxoglutarate aldolase